jgi:putative heme-binding domain-containing protein
VDDPAVRYQLALSLGEWNDPRAGQALGKLAQAGMADPWIRAAIISSAVPQTAEILKGVLATSPSAPGRNQTANDLIATAVGENNPDVIERLLVAIVPKAGAPIEGWQFVMLRTVLDGFDRKHQSLAAYATNAEMRFVIPEVKSMLGMARSMAADPGVKESLRETTIHLLGHDPEFQSADMLLLGELLQPTNSLPIQQAALETLKYNSDPHVPGLLLANWKVLSPSLRAPILEILLSREEFIHALLDALQQRVVQVAEITPANRQRLLKHANPAIRAEAAKVLQTGATHSRADVMAQYASVSTMTGDPTKGAVVFAKNCTPCHHLKGQGHAVGPNLAALIDKTPGDFLLAILDPNAAVEPRFLAYDIETKDDRSLVGVVSAESSTSLTLVQPGGIQEKILRSDITSIRATGLSLMPEGFEQGISKQDLADLIAYLKAKP